VLGVDELAEEVSVDWDWVGFVSESKTGPWGMYGFRLRGVLIVRNNVLSSI
jgi:hypothetical protein